MTTTDLSKFGNREKALLVILLQAEMNQGLPVDFNDGEVAPMMNTMSGNVFLTNSDYQVAMMNGDKLESFYNLPYEGSEGFLDDLLEEYKNNNITHKEDIDYLRDLVKQNKYGRLPKRVKLP